MIERSIKILLDLATKQTSKQYFMLKLTLSSEGVWVHRTDSKASETDQ
jgi:hypothetical protein